MPKHQQAENAPHSAVQQAALPAVAVPEDTSFTDKAVTVAAVGIAAALIEVDLIPGMLLGVAAMLAPNLLPKIGNGLRPLVKSAVRAGYNVASKAKESVAEAGEQFQDIVAEVKAEQHGAVSAAADGQARAAGPGETA